MSTSVAIALTQSSNATEIRNAILDAAQAAREAGQAARASARQAAADARTAAADAKSAAADAKTAAADNQTSARDGGPARATQDAGTIVIPSDGGGEPIRLNVDSKGIHVRQGDNQTTIPIHDVVPRGAVQMTYAICATLCVVAVAGPLLRFFLRRHERRATSAQISAQLQARLDAMDRNIDTVAVELERVSEGQRFTSRLLEQRPVEHAQRIDR